MRKPDIIQKGNRTYRSSKLKVFVDCKSHFLETSFSRQTIITYTNITGIKHDNALALKHKKSYLNQKLSLHSVSGKSGLGRLIPVVRDEVTFYITYPCNTIMGVSRFDSLKQAKLVILLSRNSVCIVSNDHLLEMSCPFGFPLVYWYIFSPVKLCGNPKQIAIQMLFTILYKVNIQI